MSKGRTSDNTQTMRVLQYYFTTYMCVSVNLKDQALRISEQMCHADYGEKDQKKNFSIMKDLK